MTTDGSTTGKTDFITNMQTLSKNEQQSGRCIRIETDGHDRQNWVYIALHLLMRSVPLTSTVFHFLRVSALLLQMLQCVFRCACFVSTSPTNNNWLCTSSPGGWMCPRESLFLRFHSTFVYLLHAVLLCIYLSRGMPCFRADETRGARLKRSIPGRSWWKH